MKIKERADIINTIKNDFKAKVSAINADDRYSTTYKQALIRAEKSTLYEELSKQREQLESDINIRVSDLEAQEPKINFSDASFMAAIDALNKLQKLTPDEISNQIIDQYQGNRKALTVFKELFDSYGLTSASIKADEILKVPSQLEKLRALSDFAYYSSTAEETLYTPEQLEAFSELDN